MPKVSVIIPSYNHEKFVAEAIQSVLDQTFQDFEIVITDDGSTDGTVEEIRKFSDPRISLFIFPENQGACVAANNCIKEASGEYIAVLSSDDAFSPDKLEKQIAYLDGHPETAAVFAYAALIDEQGRAFRDETHPYHTIFKQPNRTRHEWLHHFFYHGNCLCHPSVLIRKACYDDVGLYNEKLAQLPDFDLWVRLCMRYEIYIITEELIKFRIRKEEINASGRRPDVISRTAWELTCVLEEFSHIGIIQELQHIFPETKRFGGDLEAELIPFYVALLASEVSDASYHLFAQNTLYHLLGYKSFLRLMRNRHNFDIAAFIALTGAGDALNYKRLLAERQQSDLLSGQLALKERELFKKDQQLAEKDQQLAEKDQQLVEKDQQLAEKDQQLAEKDQQLAEKDQQLAEKDQQLAEKERHIHALLKSYSWSITAPLRWGFDFAMIVGSSSLSAVFFVVDKILKPIVRNTVEFGNILYFGLGQARMYYRVRGRLHSVRELPSLVRLAINTYFDSKKTDLHVAKNLKTLPNMAPYDAWLEVNQWNNKREEHLRRRLQEMKDTPLLSVIMPVYDPPVEFLNRAIASVCSQVYGNWELCIADDASKQGWVRDALMKWAKLDKRIKVFFRETNGNISVATNTAASLSTGNYLVFLDQDDELTPDALGEIALYLNENPDTDILYSDDDKIDAEGKRFAPQFKPAWSPELLLSYMYFSHAFVVSRHLFEEVGGDRVGFEGSQDYDLALRTSEKARHIGHIPLVLYHWRVLPHSTSSSAKAKPDSLMAGRRAVQDALLRRGIPATACQPDWAIKAAVGIYSHQFTHREYPRVAIIIPTKNRVETLSKCIDSIRDTTDYPNYEILIIDNDSTDLETLKYFQKISAEPDVRVTRISNPDNRFNFAYINNRAVEEVESEFILFLNNDTEVRSKGWLAQMVGYAQIPGVGAVGGRLLYPNKSVQHAGVIIKFYNGMAGHAFKGLTERDTGYLAYPKVLRNYSAVTAACLLTSRRLFLEMGGFDALNFGVAYNDVDYCCRLLEKRYRVVYTPEAELIHHEGHSRGYGDDPTENVNFRKKYYGKKDRYYHPCLSLDDDCFNVNRRSIFTGDLRKTIKTLMCSHNLNHEGAPYSQYEMTVGLKKKGVIDPVVFSPADGPLRALYESHGIRVVVDSSLGNVFEMAGYRERVRYFVSFIKMLGIEVVYANTLLNFHAIAAAGEAGIPSVWNIRESEPWQHYVDWWGDELAGEAARCFTYPYKVVFVARTTKALYSAFGLKHNFTVIYNGLDLKRVFDEADKYDRKTVRKELGIRNDEFALLLPGTVCERKGQHDLARAIGLLKPGCIEKVRCFIVGDWLTPHPYSEELHVIVDNLPANAKERISIVPATAEIFKYFKAADIMICTSRVESFPRIILEAMAFGLPIITTPVFGIREQVQEGVNAVFYPPGEVGTLSRAIERLVFDVETQKKFSKNSAMVLQQIENFEEMVNCYATVFMESYMSAGGRPQMLEGIITCKAERAKNGVPVKKVSFLTTYVDEFPQRFRVYNLIEELTAAGVECAVLKEDFKGGLESLFDSDLLIAFRVGLSENVLRILNEFKGKGIPTVFDVDDLVFEPESADLLHGLSSLNESDRLSVIDKMGQLRKTLLLCDYATCTTKALSKKIEAMRKNCCVIPNAINTKQFDLAQTLKSEKRPRADNKVHIGYFSGTSTHDRDFMEVSDALYEVLKRNGDVEFHLVGVLDLDTKFSRFGDRVVRKPLMDYLDMLRYLSAMDINLAPLEMNNAFTAAKSELKIFEAALVRVPTVASPTESYSNCITDGVNGFLAATKEEWVEKLERLIHDKSLRHKIAEESELEFVGRFFIKSVIGNAIGAYAVMVEDYKKTQGRR